MKPFLKWAGGKQKILKKILPYIKTNHENYYEPFLGGGAIGIHLLKENYYDNYHFNDLNKELILTYKEIKNNVHGLLFKLNQLQTNYNNKTHDQKSEFFYLIRAKFNEAFDPAFFIFLNKTCFNGLYRVNKKNKFNVSWCKKEKDIKIYDKQVLLDLHHRFQKVEFTNKSFLDVEVKPNSFVYLDPPYEKTFKDYTPDSFNLLDDLVTYVKQIDGHFVLSNSHNEVTLEAFKDFNIYTIDAPRSISCSSASDTKVLEIIVTNF